MIEQAIIIHHPMKLDFFLRILAATSLEGPEITKKKI